MHKLNTRPDGTETPGMKIFLSVATSVAYSTVIKQEQSYLTIHTTYALLF